MTDSENQSHQPVRLAIAGADGRMGQMLLKQSLHAQASRTTLASALVIPTSSWAGKNVGQLIATSSDIPLETQNEAAIQKADVLIDFTRPEGTMDFLKICVAHKKAMVIGTTGFNAEQHEQLQNAAKTIPLLIATNMSPGVNVFFHLVKKAASYLPHSDAEVMEIHHHHKADAPSGTAITLGEQILVGRNQLQASASPTEKQQALQQHADFSRVGNEGARLGEKSHDRIGFTAIRGGDVVGEHTVMLFGDGERIELRHVSTQRTHYAAGAILAAEFLADKSAGLYSMKDVLSLEN